MSTPTVVTLRPLGSPLTLGLAGLAVASLLMGGFDLGWVPTAEAHQAGLLLLVTVVPMQAVAAVLAFLSRDGGAGGTFGLQAATWAALGASHLSSPPGTTSGALGLALVAAGALLALAGTTMMRAKVLAGMAVGLSGVHFVFTGVYELAAVSGWEEAAGAVSLGVVAVAGYTSWAAELEDMADRTILPTLRRGTGRRAMDAPYDEQVGGVEHEAGVRRQL